MNKHTNTNHPVNTKSTPGNNETINWNPRLLNTAQSLLNRIPVHKDKAVAPNPIVQVAASELCQVIKKSQLATHFFFFTLHFLLFQDYSHKRHRHNCVCGDQHRPQHSR